jgi:catechol 2,3-dioxygenase
MARENGHVNDNAPIAAEARIGHVHLKISILKRSVKFHTEVPDFELTGHLGNSAAFLSAGEYHHHIGLNTRGSIGGSRPSRDRAGLYHFAILYPSRREMARALKRLIDCGWLIDGASD